jgi:hypothetical protein
MRTLQELKEAIKNNVSLAWNDPQYIKGNDYTITYIEDLNCIDEDDIEGYPILIKYGEGSEAEVYLHEILINI